MQTTVITRANIVKWKDIIESKAPNKGNNICMIGKWLVRIMGLYSPSSLDIFLNFASRGNLYVDPVLESSRTLVYAAVRGEVSPLNSSL